MNRPSTSAGPSSIKWLASFLGFLIIAGLGLAASHFTSLREVLNMESINATARTWGIWAPVFLLVLASFAPLLFLPRWPIAMVCGMLYGITGGAALANLCCTSGAWVQYQLARCALRSMGRPFGNHAWLEQLAQNRDKSFLILLVLRAFPFSSSVATNVLAGTLEIKTRVYLAATFLGMLPSTLMYAAWGKLLKQPDPPFYLVAVGILIALLVATALAHRRLHAWLQATPIQPTEGDTNRPERAAGSPDAADPGAPGTNLPDPPE